MQSFEGAQESAEPTADPPPVDANTADSRPDAEQSRLRAMLDSLSDPHALLDAVRDPSGSIVDFIYVEANPAACDRLGVTQAELIGSRLLDRFPDRRSSGLFDRYRACVDTHERLALRDVPAVDEGSGESRWFDFFGVPSGDGLALTWRDVTEAHDLLERVRESETRFRLAMTHSAIGMCLIDPDGSFIEVSPALCDLLGRDEATLRSTTWQAMTHPEDLDADLALVTDVLEGRRDSYRLRKRYLRPDGAVVWGDLAVAGVRDTDGRFLYFISQIVDVSDTVIATHQLTSERAMLRTTLDGLLDPHVLLDAVRGSDGIITDFIYVDANPAALAYLGGLRRQDLVGTRLRAMYPSEAAVMLVSQYAATVDSGEPLVLDDYAYPNEQFEGEERRYDLRGVRIGESISLTWRDVTDRHLEAERLADSEARYRLLADSAADVVVRTDGSDRFTYVSPAVTDLLGWKPEDLVGTPAAHVHPPDEIRHRVDVIAAAAAVGETKVSTRTRLLHRDGTWRWASVNGRRLYDSDGKSQGSQVAWRDITREVAAEEELAESEARYRLLAENSLDVILQVDLESRIHWASPSAYDVLGWAPEVLVGRRSVDLVHHDDRAELGVALTQAVTEHAALALIVRYLRGDGTHVWMEAAGQHVDPGEGRDPFRVVRLRDVDAEVRANRSLAESEARYRMLAEHISDVIVQTGPEGLISYVSPSITSMLGWAPHDLVGESITALLRPEKVDDLRTGMRELAQAGEGALGVEAEVCTVEGGWVWVSIVGQPVRDENGRVIGGVDVMRDISAEVLARRELEALASTDLLTGLLNRSEIETRLDVIMSHPPRSGSRLAFLFFDLDGLKSINDTYGHAAGDLLLKTTALRIRALVRDDDLVARVGGDELLVVLHGAGDPSGVAGLAEKIGRAVAEPIVDPERPDAPPMRSTVSIGAAMAKPEDTAAEAIARADEAMYRAKRQGGGRVALTEDTAEA